MITTQEFFKYVVGTFYQNNQAQAADDLEITRASMSSYTSGSTDAKYSTILKVYEKFKDQLNPEWVLGQSDVPEKVSAGEELTQLRAKVTEMKSDMKALQRLLGKY